MKFFDKLKSTTREERNTNHLHTLFSFIDKENIDTSQKKILIIGPWGIVKSFSSLLPKWLKSNISQIKKIQHLIINQFESFLRKTWKFKLKSFEIAEVLNLIKKSGKEPKYLYVADCEKRILDILEDDSSDIKLKPLLWNIENWKAEEKFDIVICYNVIQRLNNKEEGLKSVVDSTTNNWIISLDMWKFDLNLEEFWLTKISDNLYQKQISEW